MNESTFKYLHVQEQNALKHFNKVPKDKLELADELDISDEDNDQIEEYQYWLKRRDWIGVAYDCWREAYKAAMTLTPGKEKDEIIRKYGLYEKRDTEYRTILDWISRFKLGKNKEEDD